MIKTKELLYFGAAGVLGYAVDVLITSLGEHALGVYAARIPAFICAATITWIFNRTFTFGKHDRVHSAIWKEYLHYLSLMVLGLCVNYVVYAVSITAVKGHAYSIYLCVALGSLAGMLVNYLNSKKYLYKEQ